MKITIGIELEHEDIKGELAVLLSKVLAVQPNKKPRKPRKPLTPKEKEALKKRLAEGRENAAKKRAEAEKKAAKKVKAKKAK